MTRSPDLTGFTPRPLPGEVSLHGRRVRLDPFCPARHGPDLARAVSGPANRDIWTFMPIDPVDDTDSFPAIFSDIITRNGWAAYVIADQDTAAVLGTASYMRQRPEHGSCEVGCVAFSPHLKRTAHASEAIYLMASHVFDDLGYRRFEWKCHDGNTASKNAAIRFGFRFEGVFRNDMVMKGKSRDTAWFAMTDADWPEVSAGFVTWLDPANFDQTGQQKISLSSLRSIQQIQQQQQ